MARHLERVLGMDDERPDETELTVEDYLSQDEAPPVEEDIFASNTELDGPVENPLDAQEPFEDNETSPLDFAPPELDEGPAAEPSEDTPEEEITDSMREAITARFIENARNRLLNSKRFQDRAEILNDGTEEDEEAGL